MFRCIVIKPTVEGVLRGVLRQKKPPLLEACMFLERATGLAYSLRESAASGALHPRTLAGKCSCISSVSRPLGSSPCSMPKQRRAPLLGPLSFMERATGLEPASVSFGSFCPASLPAVHESLLTCPFLECQTLQLPDTGKYTGKNWKN